MQNFEFRTVGHIAVAFGGARNLGARIRTNFPLQKRVCVVTDSHLRTSGLIAPALASLEQHGLTVNVIDDVVADPPDHVILKAARRAKQAGAELVVGFGGGSSMDVAKVLAVLCVSEQPLSEMYGVDKVRGERLPLVQIPTTAGTGSEVTCVAIVTTGASTKAGIVSPRLYADLALLDAELTLELPAAATAATGIDAMVHAIEAYTSAPWKNPLSDSLACQALVSLAKYLPRVCTNDADTEAREGMLLGAMLAGQAFANAPVAAVHALAYPLGGVFHIPHGLSNALVLPHVLRFNASVCHTLYNELASVVLKRSFEHSHAGADAFIQYCAELSPTCGIPDRLRDVGVRRSDLGALADEAMLQRRLLINNPRNMTRDDALTIYEAAY